MGWLKGGLSEVKDQVEDGRRAGWISQCILDNVTSEASLVSPVFHCLLQKHQAHRGGVDGRIQAVLLRGSSRSPREALWKVSVFLCCLCPACALPAAVGVHGDVALLRKPACIVSVVTLN